MEVPDIIISMVVVGGQLVSSREVLVAIKEEVLVPRITHRQARASLGEVMHLSRGDSKKRKRIAMISRWSRTSRSLRRSIRYKELEALSAEATMKGSKKVSKSQSLVRLLSKISL
jgi:hypothetical protein